jgi:hypothetical protein
MSKKNLVTMHSSLTFSGTFPVPKTNEKPGTCPGFSESVVTVVIVIAWTTAVITITIGVAWMPIIPRAVAVTIPWTIRSVRTGCERTCGDAKTNSGSAKSASASRFSRRSGQGRCA